VGYDVCGYDLSSRHADVARRMGLVDELGSSPGETAAGAEFVFVAVPVLRSLKLLLTLDQFCDPQTVILDTGSAKRVVVEAMSILPGAARMVGGHPLAGSERSGPEAADERLFEGKSFFLCPSPSTSPHARARAQAIVAEIGALPVWKDAAEHDRALATTSHLPQILASLLAIQAGDPGRYAGPAFRDMTRLAASDAAIWRDILLANADEVVRVGRTYRDALSSLLDSIEGENVAAIEQTLLDGRRARSLVEAGV
jgi:prephenate dehydrogenase